MNQNQNNLGKISIECMKNPSNNNGLETMKVTSLEIKDVGGIPSLKLENINPQMNIICGENGVGKTNILDSIASCFSQYDKNNIRKRNFKRNKKNEENIFANKRKELIDFFKNKEEPFLNKFKSHKTATIICPNCNKEHAGGAGGVPVHPPKGSRISGDEPLIPDPNPDLSKVQP